MQEILIVMKRAMENASIQVDSYAVPSVQKGSEIEPSQPKEGQKQKCREPSPIRYPLGKPATKENPTVVLKRNNKAKDPRAVHFDLLKGKGPQGIGFPREKLAPKIEEIEGACPYIKSQENQRVLPEGILYRSKIEAQC
uniref:Uncharacterized protein n=1 Tax=Cannabis sativa TaxID=3483 RepID=A0A803Q8V5_CANSA